MASYPGRACAVAVFTDVRAYLRFALATVSPLDRAMPHPTPLRGAAEKVERLSSAGPSRS